MPVECARQKICAATKARNDAVLGRLGLPVQDVTLPSPRPPPFPKRSIRSPQRRRRNAPLSDVPRFNTEVIDRHQSPGSLDEEDDSFWEKVLLGSQMAALTCKEAQMADRDQSSTSSLSSVDCQTPSELRAIALIEEPTTPPPPPPRAVPLFRRRMSRLPVLSAKYSGAEKEVADGCRLQSAKGKVEAFVERLKCLQLASIPSPRPPAAPKTTPAVTPLAPTPPRVPQAQKQGTRPGVALRPAKAVSVAGKDTTTDCSPNAAKDKKVKNTELQPLTDPVQSLSACFKLLSLDDWEKKIDGLKIIQALVQHHPDTLRTKVHEVCLVLIEEVNNLRSAVACEAMDTLAELYVHLRKAMDPEAEGTGRALLLKLAQTTSAFIHQQANLALDALVDNCSHGRIVSALLNAGLSHRCAAVRGSMAQHLHQLADSLGAARILTAGRTLTERFLLAVSKMCIDGAPEVRHHGQIVLLKLADHKDFIKLWTKIVPVNERPSLDKILKKAKK
uniref:crescerin-like protein che-12 n=1 Tax=Epinephelus lanceolatus TaxID=310571 RepID=UPI001446DD09|nr:crescerin-like protein che-12 [Epinephelus lanceolatus]